MVFSLALLLIPYYLGILFFFLFSFFNLYHLIRFGVANTATIFMFFAYIGGMVIILGTSFLIINQIDWSREIEIFSFINSYQI